MTPDTLRIRRTKRAGVAAAMLVCGLCLASPAAAEVIATVGETSVTEADIALHVKGPLLRLHTQIYEVKKRAADAIIDARLLDEEAARRGVSRAQLLQQEVDEKTAAVGDAAVAEYYDANAAQFDGRPLEEIRDRLQAALQARAKAERRAAFIAELRQDVAIDFAIGPPIVEVPVGVAPAKGPSDARVTLVEFSDYQ